ncbi:type VI secretion system lipoprotein TssJ [Halorhodospira halophila]|uniref:type VI secretion system lipoprotein TssJ n=1 Tax=Halorhodospira halophila TaxID=1053 RepID=UPI00164EFCC4|nr:type VI secretion system lipoprotein TssJ [Halorhodospira halophila]
MALLLCAWAAAGCTPRVELDMTAGPQLNPGPQGEPLSVLLRVYQLDDRTPFEDADRAALTRDDRAALGGWEQRRELVLQPGERKEVELEMADPAGYLAVAVFYLDEQAERWRLLEPLPESFLGMRPGQRITLALDGGALWAGSEAERRRAAWQREDVAGQRSAGL